MVTDDEHQQLLGEADGLANLVGALEDQRDNLIDAIAYALEKNDLEWLRAWNYGDAEAMEELKKWQATRATIVSASST